MRLLEISASCLTPSGGVQEEAPAFGKPVLVMRETTERPEGIAAGTARLVGANADRIVAETERLLDDEVAYASMAQAHSPLETDGARRGSYNFWPVILHDSLACAPDFVLSRARR